MRRPSPSVRHPLSVLLIGAVLAGAGGCGSKISEANYFRVRYGMSEEEVEELLGPAHHESSEPLPNPPAVTPPLAGPSPASSLHASSRPALRKVKAWSRDGITIRVVFEHGFVTGRSAEGIAADPPTTGPSVPTNPPVDQPPPAIG